MAPNPSQLHTAHMGTAASRESRASGRAWDYWIALEGDGERTTWPLGITDADTAELGAMVVVGVALPPTGHYSLTASDITFDAPLFAGEVAVVYLNRRTR